MLHQIFEITLFVIFLFASFWFHYILGMFLEEGFFFWSVQFDSLCIWLGALSPFIFIVGYIFGTISTIFFPFSFCHLLTFSLRPSGRVLKPFIYCPSLFATLGSYCLHYYYYFGSYYYAFNIHITIHCL